MPRPGIIAILDTEAEQKRVLWVGTTYRISAWNFNNVSELPRDAARPVERLLAAFLMWLTRTQERVESKLPDGSHHPIWTAIRSWRSENRRVYPKVKRLLPCFRRGKFIRDWFEWNSRYCRVNADRSETEKLWFFDQRVLKTRFFGMLPPTDIKISVQYPIDVDPEELQLLADRGILESPDVVRECIRQFGGEIEAPIMEAEEPPKPVTIEAPAPEQPTEERRTVADLGKILALLDERNIAKEVSLKHDRAREQYTVAKDTISSFDEFKREITKFYQHQFGATVGKIDDVEMAEGYAIDIVEQAFASQGGLEGAYEIAEKGIRGGLRAIINAIHEALKSDQETRYVDYVLRTYVNPLDWDDRVALMEQYVSRFGRYLPPGDEMKSPMQLAANYDEVLKIHTRVLSSIRSRIVR